MGGDGFHELTWGRRGWASSFYLGPQAGGCWPEPESGITGDQQKGEGFVLLSSVFVASVFSTANWG